MSNPWRALRTQVWTGSSTLLENSAPSSRTSSASASSSQDLANVNTCWNFSSTGAGKPVGAGLGTSVGEQGSSPIPEPSRASVARFNPDNSANGPGPPKYDSVSTNSSPLKSPTRMMAVPSTTLA